MSGETVIRRTSKEYLKAEVTCSVVLDAQTVEFSYDDTDPDGWMAGDWEGPAGTTRVARLLLDDSKKPAAPGTKVFVRVTDNPEIPVMLAGVLEVA